MSATRIAIAVVERVVHPNGVGDGHFLIGRRPQETVLPGYAEFPGGKVEAHESPREAAVRECAEETGISIAPVRLFDQVRHRYEHGDVELHFFYCHATTNSPPQNGFRWVSHDELQRIDFPPANRSVLNKLLSVGKERC